MHRYGGGLLPFGGGIPYLLEGDTVHHLYAGATSGDLERVYVFDGFTLDLGELVFTPDEPLKGIAVLRVETVESPSWVSWREIEVIAAGD